MGATEDHGDGVRGSGMTTTLTDRAAACLERHLDGDRSGFDDLVEEVTPLLWHVARSNGASRWQAEDVVQRAFLALVRHAERIDEPRAVVSWLVTTTKRDAWRARGREHTGRADDIPDTLGQVDGDDVDWVATATPERGPDEATELSSEAEVLWAHVQSLPQRCRALLRVIAFSDRPDYASISEALDMPIGSIGPTRGRCLAKLRALLEEDETWTSPTGERA